MAGEVTLQQRQRLAENLANVREQIATAAVRAGRRKVEIKLVAVTKYVSTEIASVLYDLGCVDLGESRPQELWNKAEALNHLSIRWHLIGQLQRNKIRRTIPLASLIHSVDRESLLTDLDKEASQLGQQTKMLLEVNISGDLSKSGFTAATAQEIAAKSGDFPHLSISGLMGMSGLESDATERRRQFASLRNLGAAIGDNLELSMGMSEDFPIAIEEGATIVRVGSALFEGVVGD